MSRNLHLEYLRTPSALGYMFGAFHRSPGFGAAGFPDVRVAWHRHRIDPRHLSEFLRLTRLPPGDGVSILYPHVLGFRLLMVVLTHRAFPLPIWSVLQIRNHLLQHRPIPADAELDLETRVAGHRVLDKGVELDLHTAVRSGGDLAWESLNTFYYRGRFGPPGAPSPLAAAPALPEPAVARWPVPPGPGWPFARLTGDYNGVHWWNAYARRFRFRRAFHHPQLVLGQALAHLRHAAPGPSQRLDVWLKGPVYYGAELELRAGESPGDVSFALAPSDEQRPAILGRWCAAAGEALVPAAPSSG